MNQFFHTVLVIMTGVMVYADNGINITQGMSVSEKNGCLSLFSSIKTEIFCAAPGWKSIARQSLNFNPTATFSHVNEHDIVFNGKFRTDAGDFECEERLTKNEKGIDCYWRLKSTAGIDSALVYLFFSLPVKCYAGAKIGLDDKLYTLTSDTKATSFTNVSSITIPGKNSQIVISGKLNGQIRLESGTYYNIKLWFTPLQGIIKNSSLKFNLAIEKLSSQPLDISMAANTSFTDENDGDRQGGWTDQGSKKDLRSLKPGLKELGGIKFNIIDASQNHNKACIVLKGQERSYFPEKATIPLSGLKYRQLYLLHTSAWCTSVCEREKTPVGKIKVIYQDETIEEIEVVSGIDVQDWTSGFKLKNAVPVWTGKSDTFSDVVLNLSAFPLQFKELKSITLISANNRPVWMIAALSGSINSTIPLQDDGTKTIVYQADKNWKSIDWKPLQFVKGSALDISSPLDAPAGKYGEVYWKGDNFYFKHKPGVPVRFYGINLTNGLPFLLKKQAEQMADYFAAIGYNTVRFHIYYGWIVKGGTPELLPEPLDKLCYLLHCLRQRGIYYSLELWGATSTSFQIIHDPAIPEFSDKKITRSTLMGLVPISPPAMEYIKTFARNILLHVNPYTGIAIKDDPALSSVEMINENSIYFIFKVQKKDLQMAQVWKRKCGEYLTRRNSKPATEEDIKKFLPEFMLLMQDQSTAELIAYLREIGLKKAITGLGFEPTSIATEISRQQLDYVDNHAYTQIAEGIPVKLTNNNPNTEKWLSQLQGGAARLFGKPFAMGEYNMSYPTPHWSYIIPAEATIAGLQNWSRTCFFGLQALPQWVFEPYPSSGVQSSNPMIFMESIIGAMLFREGEVQASKIKIPYVVTPEYIYSKLDTQGAPHYPAEYSVLGLCCQIGTVIYHRNTDLSLYPCIVIPPDMPIPPSMKGIQYFRSDAELHRNLKPFLPGLGGSVFKSTTGQTVLNEKQKTFRTVTPRTECFMLPEEVNKIDGANVAISGNHRTSTCFVGSLDQQSIEYSKRLLAMYITDIKNTGTVIKQGVFGIEFIEKGKVPFLLLQGSVTFTVKTENSTLPQVWALKYDGSRKLEVKPEKTNGGYRFTVNAVTTKDAYFAYEIIWH